MNYKNIKLLQVSKEYFKGKWQHVEFYKNINGQISIKPLKINDTQ